MLAPTFRCLLVDKDADEQVTAEFAERTLDDLPRGDVLIRVAYSSLNYKDALALKGHPGVARAFPLVPGVDAAGRVVESGVYEFVEGDQVLVTGYDMGVTHWGGYAEYVRAPQDWIVPMPEDMTPRESMMLGTAGLTAGLCVHSLQHQNVHPQGGQIVVTGASGGVGSFAVALLARLGYDVVAVTGKEAAHDYLRALGAAEVVGREEVTEATGKPLLSGRWAGAVDTVGGTILATVLRQVRHFGCVAACGNAGGHELSMTVYPFILRAVTLAGVDAAMCPLPLRHEIWGRLAGPWKLDCLCDVVEMIDLADLPPRVDDILQGRIRGRLAVKVGGDDEGGEYPRGA